jgi:hypothetical protein
MPGSAIAGDDVSMDYGHALHAKAIDLFGFVQPLENSATPADTVPRDVADAVDRQLLAKGLQAEFVTRTVGGNGDMITFWPNDTEIHWMRLTVRVVMSGRACPMAEITI